MQNQSLAYLVAHPNDEPNTIPIEISYQQLATTFQFTKDSKSLSDDPWRSLAGYSRKVQDVPTPAVTCTNGDKYCQRCFYRGCSDGSQKKW